MLIPTPLLEVLALIFLILGIIVFSLSIYLLVRMLSAAKKIDDFFGYFQRFQAVLEAFEGIPGAVVGVVKDMLLSFVGRERDEDEKSMTTLSKKRQK